jgi:hypothetical protein
MSVRKMVLSKESSKRDQRVSWEVMGGWESEKNAVAKSEIT